MKWSLKHCLLYWEYIIKFIIIAYEMQYIYFVSVKDGILYEM